MDVRQVEYAIAVADELHFTRAAQRVHVSQSTLSAGVQALERELGATLFLRGTGGVRLAPGGEAILPDLRDLVEAAARARTAADPGGGLRGTLRIGVFSNLTHLDLPTIIGDLHRAHPAVDLRIRPVVTGSSGLAEDVRRGRLDVALYGSPGDPGPGLVRHRIASGPFAAYLPPGHRLAGRASVTLAELSEERFIDTPEGFGNRSTLDAAFGAAGVNRAVATEIADLGAIPRYVEVGLGVAALPAFMIDDEAGAIVVPIAPRIEWLLAAVTRPEPSAVVRDFLERTLGAER